VTSYSGSQVFQSWSSYYCTCSGSCTDGSFLVMPVDLGHPRESVVHLLHRAAQVADASFMRHSAGLTPRVFEILKAVAAAGGLSQIEIMAATGIDRSSVASLVAKLVGMRLVSRRKRASDNRAYAVHVTSRGRLACAATWQLPIRLMRTCSRRFRARSERG
jgi:DNA-binding MarR family transcriptional regulator